MRVKLFKSSSKIFNVIDNVIPKFLTKIVLITLTPPPKNEIMHLGLKAQKFNKQESLQRNKNVFVFLKYFNVLCFNKLLRFYRSSSGKRLKKRS